jgi:DNA-binding CsgD family transcriptional regulator/pimeloyl-ACP methyl ester carboxylesterase
VEPRIRFARTFDGLSIAFWVYGSGPPLLHLPWLPWGHAQLEWQNPELHLWYERLSSVCRLIRYDGRGAGLSDRESPSYGVDSQVADIEAVAERLGIDTFAVLASLNMGPAAISFAAKHPSRVSRLVLWCTYASTLEYNRAPQVNAIRALLYKDWQLYTETGAHAFVGWPSGDAAHQIAELMRRSTTEEICKQFYDDMTDVDCSPLLAQLSMPVAIMHPREFPLVDIAAVRRLASAIPDARLSLFEGSSLSPTRGDLDGVVTAIRDFLEEDRALETAPSGVSSEPPGAAHTTPAHEDNLSPREVEVLSLLAKGMSNREIAERLVLSPRTVERHIENIYAKIGVNNRVQAAAYAASNEL